MAGENQTEEGDDVTLLRIRMSVLETRVNLISKALIGVVAILCAGLVKWVFFNH